MHTNILASLLSFGILLASFFHAVYSKDNTDTKGCPPGQNCTCGQCLFNDTCDQETGYCRKDCQPGYKGKGCFIKCGPDEDCVNPCSCQNSCQCDRQRLVCDVACQELIQHNTVVVKGLRHKTAVYVSLIMAIGLILIGAILVWAGDHCVAMRRSDLTMVQGDGPNQGAFSSALNPSVQQPDRIADGPVSNERIGDGVRSSPIDEEDRRRKRHYRKDRRFGSSRASRSIIDAPYRSESENLARETPFTDFAASTRTGDTKNSSSWTGRSVLVGNSDLITTAEMEDASSSTDTTEFLTMLSPLSNARCIAMMGSTEYGDYPEEKSVSSGSSLMRDVQQTVDAQQHSEPAAADDDDGGDVAAAVASLEQPALSHAPCATVTTSDPIQVDHAAVATPSTTPPNTSLSLEGRSSLETSLSHVALAQNREGAEQLSAQVALNVLQPFLDSPPEGRHLEPIATETDEMALSDKE